MTSKLNAKSPTIRRILREAQELAASPSADVAAAPLEADLFEWHFTLRGPPNSAYADGLYHGRIVLPPTYPLRPPSFRFLTPSGRFEANREICLSISGHHEETWQPAWGLRTALVALRAFMESDPKGQVGGLDASDAVRRRLAAESGAFVCTGCGGRSNAAILAESAEEERLLGKEDDEKDKVPAELQLVFRDELAADTEDKGKGRADAEPVPEPVPETPPVPQPAHAVPVPTPTIPLPELREPPTQTQARRHSDEAVPLWVDRTIVVLCIVLAAMLLRIVFG